MNMGFGALCDEFYVSTRLFLRLDMPYERETILHFFDRLRKEYPRLKKLRRRENGSLVLEEEADDDGPRRWIRLDQGGIRFGIFSPHSMDAVRQFGKRVLSQAPFHLTFSEIDYDHLEVVYGFDLEYRGNHDQLVAETLMGDQAAVGFLMGDRSKHIIDAQPYFGIALSTECDLQAYIEVKSRTTTYEIRSNSFETTPISVFLTARKYWTIDGAGSLEDGLTILHDQADELAAEVVVPNFVNPLAAAIASRS